MSRMHKSSISLETQSILALEDLLHGYFGAQLLLQLNINHLETLQTSFTWSIYIHVTLCLCSY